MKNSYVDFLCDEEEFVWDSTSWNETYGLHLLIIMYRRKSEKDLKKLSEE